MASPSHQPSAYFRLDDDDEAAESQPLAVTAAAMAVPAAAVADESAPMLTASAIDDNNDDIYEYTSSPSSPTLSLPSNTAPAPASLPTQYAFMDATPDASTSSSTATDPTPPPPSELRRPSSMAKLHAPPSDGVFANLSAKPSSSPAVQPLPHSAPNSPAELPPYEATADDAVPPYPVLLSDTTDDAQLVNGLPVGAGMTFVITMVVSMAFQVVGFLICFIFSVDHAGRMGARAGFGLSMIHYAVFLQNETVGGDMEEGQPPHSGWISGFMLILGAFLTIQAAIDFARVRALQRIMALQPDQQA